MTTNNIIPVPGSDNVVPQIERGELNRLYDIEQIFMGIDTPGAGRWIPKPGDSAWNPQTLEFWYVRGLDLATLKPDLDPVKPIGAGVDIDPYDQLVGDMPGTRSAVYRAYIDNTNVLKTVHLEARQRTYNPEVNYYRLYRGTIESGDYKIISRHYDQSGNYLGADVPFLLAAINQVENYTIKTPASCKTTESIPDNEVITLVGFAASGAIVMKQSYIVDNGGYVGNTDTGYKQIDKVFMRSIWIRESNPTVLEIPLHVPIESLNILGVVRYTTGEEVEMPIDGTRFHLGGIPNFIATGATERDKTYDIVLRYFPASDEYSPVSEYGERPHISVPYKMRTTKTEPTYLPKLYAYPEWVSSTLGYRLRWFLYNTQRNIHYDVTDKVRLAANTRPFDPTAYGVNQRLNAQVNLNEVNGIYKKWVYAQLIDIALMAPGDEVGTNWLVGFELGQNPPYGQNVSAVTTFVQASLTKVDVSLGLTSQEEWLKKLYYDTIPLVNPDSESVPPEPNFFRISYRGDDYEFPISNWQDDLQIGRSFVDTDTLYVKFIRRIGDTNLFLSVAGLPIHQTN